MTTATTGKLRTTRTKPADVCRLTVTIRGESYSARPTPNADGPAWRLKRQGTIYDVATTPHGLACDCPDFSFRRDGIDPHGCKHVRALRALGLVR